MGEPAATRIEEPTTSERESSSDAPVRTTPPTSQTLSSSDGSTSTRAVQTTRPELPPSSTASVPALASIHPCELVEEKARSELWLSEPTAKKLGDARVCRFRKTGSKLATSFTVSVEIFDRLGAADIIATITRRLPSIGNHRAVRYTGTAGGCVVSLPVAEKARVDATVIGGDQNLGCEIAERFAAVVEPGLPKG